MLWQRNSIGDAHAIWPDRALLDITIDEVVEAAADRLDRTVPRRRQPTG